jgi:periplasmic protein TonB
MHLTLPESRAGRQPATGGTIVSIITHVLLLGGAIVGTARSATTRVESPTEIVVYTRPDPDQAPPIESEHPTPGIPVDNGIPAPTLPPVDLTIEPVTLAIDSPLTTFDPDVYGTRAPLVGTTPANGPPPDAGAPFDMNAVEKVVVPRPGNPAPRYPELLRSAGVEGSVTARFVVDTLGTVEPASVRIVQATHVLFEQSVREAIRRMRFVPAELQGRRVRQLVEQRYGFTITR